MKHIYLAIPYTGMESESFRIANLTAARLMNEGHLVFSPISHSHPIAKQCDLPGDHAYWKEWNRSFIEHWADEVHVVSEHEGQPLPWRESTGVQDEIEVAEMLSKPVVLIGAE